MIKFVRSTPRQWQYVFADPPYDMKGIHDFPAQVLESGILAPGGLFVVEHFNAVAYETVKHFAESRHYGQSVFSFFTWGL